MSASPPPTSSSAPGSLAPGLRILSHNVRGLQSATQVHALVSLWVHLKAHVICVQETHLGSIDAISKAQHHLNQATQQLGLPPFSYFWDCREDSCNRSGVGILVRSDLIQAGRLVVHNSAPAPVVSRQHNGRLLPLSISWGGHKLCLASVYLPSGDPHAQRRLISEVLGPLYQAYQASLTLMGDFNFSLDVGLDRFSSVASSNTPHPDRLTSSLFTSTCPKLPCAFRHRHPTRRSFTHFWGTGASRLDRAHISEQLLPYVLQCQPANSLTSDHRPLLLHLRPAVPDKVGPGAKRTRMHFAKVGNLREGFSTWLSQTSQSAPPIGEDDAFLQWWPDFKVQVTKQAASFNRLAATIRRSCSDAVQAAQASLAESFRSVEVGFESALPQVVSHRQTLLTARRCAARATVGAARREWLHSRERPCPLLTQLERPPLASRLVPALRAPSGGLVTDRRIPAVVGAYWASISSPPPSTHPNDPAQEEVLAAHRQACTPLPPAVADPVGALSVTAFECRKALSQSPPGKSPGPDGIPVELYRTFADTFTPLLSRLFSAMGTKETLPHEFLEGLLIILRKGGDHLDPGNYRPITLLNTDYKLLAKILANRLGPVLPQLISPDQTAFLPGRQIGQSILFLQLYPELLKAHEKSGVFASLVSGKLMILLIALSCSSAWRLRA